MSAELKEVVGPIDRADFEQGLPQFGQFLFGLGLWRRLDLSGCLSSLAEVWFGQGAAIDFAAGCQGQVAHRFKMRGNHVFREPFTDELAECFSAMPSELGTM